jgi:hypothetical protein
MRVAVIGTLGGGVVAGFLNTLPLHAQMYRGGWTLAGVNVRHVIHTFIPQILTHSLNYLLRR